MPRSNNPPLFNLVKNTTTLFLQNLEQIHSHTYLQLTQQQQQQQNHIISLLQKHPTNHHLTQQLHSHSLTTASLHHHHSMLLFNTLLRCYSLSNSPFHSFLLYIHSPSPPPPSFFDSFTYAFLIKTCANLSYPFLATQLHSLSFKAGFEFHVYVQTALVNMYAVCGLLVDASNVFYEMPERNLVTWNAMITGLVKWGELEMATSLFEEMPVRTVVSWTGIIDGFTRMNRFDEALALFRRMVVHDCIEPTEITILAILQAILHIGDVKLCQLFHGYGEKRGFNTCDIRVSNSLVDTYAKCGCIVSALRFFEEISAERKNLVSWTSMISGFAMHGMGKEAVECFERMAEAGLKPNQVTFLSVLNACSHGGLVEEGLSFFEKMVNESDALPNIKIYGCLVDMLGRAGRLEEAERIALEVPSETANVVIWRTLLSACSFHGNVEMGERVTRKILEMDRGYGGDYVLMYNIFAGVGRFQDAERLRNLMDERNAFKLPGHSLV
ncbi:PPR domain-containing protein/PPR_2 domain-containing protein [Cephalotus follicularis]|uniref:PPR domain-containing protein/PPR_2 domain-containing protein n=1 Tax=Cephalotus follicularis TaxID=3775 RepID=A0A1Q3D105_CEPFO|nr:PPR domain-containing protein/PPR_2 domain-containing protein [Cephalotus follicularis]